MLVQLMRSTEACKSLISQNIFGSNYDGRYYDTKCFESIETRKGVAQQMKMSNKNKLISGLVGVAMCPMMLPTAAFAADDGTASGGVRHPRPS